MVIEIISTIRSYQVFLTDINLIGESKVSIYVGKFYNDIISGDTSLKIHTCTVGV